MRSVGRGGRNQESQSLGSSGWFGVKAMASRPDSPECCIPDLKSFLKHQTFAPTNEVDLNPNPITAKSGEAATVL